VELVRPEIVGEAFGVGQPDLADEDALARVAVGDAAPSPVDIVELVPVGVRVVAGCRRLRDLGEGWILDEERGRIDPDPAGAAVEPEAEDGLVLARGPRGGPS